MKKTIWIPIVIGLIAGGMNYLTTVVNFHIPIPGGYIGAGEIFSTLTAALGGPVAVGIDGLVHGIVGYGMIREVFPWPTPLHLVSADSFAHIISMLAAAFCYRFLHDQRSKNSLALIAGWALIVAMYYYAFLTPAQVLLLNSIIPGLVGTYMDLARITWAECFATIFITSLILLALPERYRKPQWVERQPASPPAEDRA